MEWTIAAIGLAALLRAVYLTARGLGYIPDPYQWRIMRGFGYSWTRHCYEWSTSSGRGDEHDVVRRVFTRNDGLWYASAHHYEHEPWHVAEWVSDVGFVTPAAAHVFAEVEQWPAS